MSNYGGGCKADAVYLPKLTILRANACSIQRLIIQIMCILKAKI